MRAPHGVDLTPERGRTLGLVGESGGAKSIARLAAPGLPGALAPGRGSATFEGREPVGMPERRLTGVRGGRESPIFRDPPSAPNPVQRIGRRIGGALRPHRGLSGRAAMAEAGRLLDRVGIADAGQRLNEHPHEPSGGMTQRAMIAMARPASRTSCSRTRRPPP